MSQPFLPIGSVRGPQSWSYFPGLGWLSTSKPLSQAELDEKTRVEIELLGWDMLWQAYEIDLILVGSEAWATQQLEYEVAVICDTIEWAKFTWWDHVKWYIDDLVVQFEKLLKAIHFKTILAVHQVAMLVSPQYRAMMNRIFKSMSELSKAIGMGPAFIALAVRSTRTLVIDITGALGKSYDLGQLDWLVELEHITKMIGVNAKKYADNPFQLFLDLEEDIERRWANVHGSVESSTLLVIEGLLKGVGKAAADIDKINEDAVKLLNDLPSFVKSHIDPEVFRVMSIIDGFITGEFLPKMQSINGIFIQYGNDIRAAQAAAAAAAARILTPKQTVLSLRDLPVIEQDEVLAGLDSLSMRRSIDLQSKIALWTRPAVEEVERLIGLPEPVKRPPAFLTFEHSLSSVPSLTAPVSANGPFVGDY